MGSPVSDVEVCNLSLDLLKAGELITSLETPETELEALAARWYDATRRSVLRMFPWNFARKRDTLSRNTTAPEFQYADAYDLPNDYIGLVFVGDNPTTDYETDYLIEGDQLLIDNDGASSLKVCYIYDIQNVQKFDPIFLMLLAGELGVVFGNTISGLNKSLKMMEKIRDRWEAKARAKNGQENPPRVRSESPLLTSRRNARRATSSDGIHLFT